MTDFEKLISLCKSLGLKLCEEKENRLPEPNEYCVVLARNTHSIQIGGGCGKPEEYMQFDFDLDGKATSHAIWHW